VHESCLQMRVEKAAAKPEGLFLSAALLNVAQSEDHATMLHRLCGCGLWGTCRDISQPPWPSTMRIEAPALRIRSEACHIPE